MRDVLIVANRERDVEIGIGPQLGRDERISRNISDGLQQPFAQFFNTGLCVRPSDRMRDIFNEFGAQSRIGIVILRLGNGNCLHLHGKEMGRRRLSPSTSTPPQSLP